MIVSFPVLKYMNFKYLAIKGQSQNVELRLIQRGEGSLLTGSPIEKGA
jgi:hypothetical protein